jgi:flagellar basal-body rod protein FlgB
MSDASIATALRRQMAVAVARQVIAAGNLANVDTPGFRAQEGDFDRALDSRIGGALPLATTSASHLPVVAGAPAVTTHDAGGPPRRDGNTVQLDRELLNMAEATGDFAKAQTALAAKFRLVRYAINEGR